MIRIAIPEIVVTLHDDIDNNDTKVDDTMVDSLACYLLSTEWRPRRRTLASDGPEHPR